MRAMSKERDIDDILASLNQLLHEGESHNDDHVETGEHGEVDHHAEMDKQTEEIEIELRELEEEFSDVAAMEEEPKPTQFESIRSEPEQSEPEQPESEQAEAFEWFQDEPIEDDVLEDFDDAPISVQRVVLTEDMLVDNPQGSLLSMANSEEAANEVVEHETEQSAELDLELLVEKVSDDVMNQLQQELPAMIKASLHRHLGDLKNSE
jgi:hypothetical protein